MTFKNSSWVLALQVIAIYGGYKLIVATITLFAVLIGILIGMALPFVLIVFFIWFVRLIS